jgi:putative heme-binding domain-containing protein
LTTIRIGTIPEKMRYDVTKLTVKPGKKVKLTFANYDFMPHNIMLVKPGKADDVGLKAIALGAKGFEVGYVPESPDILWSIKLVDYGQQQDIQFTAPLEEGAYPYVCTFPGHHLLMRGTLYVTNNLEEYLAKHPEDEVKITEWKLADLAGDLKRVAEHRNFERGEQLFTKLACAQCHQLNQDQKNQRQNVNVGPNLREVVKKYKGDAQAVLHEILEPSRNIEEKYRTVALALDDGTIVNGTILQENEETVTILTGSNPVVEQKIPTSSIDARKPSAVSLMPVGLLNSLDKEQILDLLAYVLAEGDAKAPAFQHRH